MKTYFEKKSFENCKFQATRTSPQTTCDHRRSQFWVLDSVSRFYKWFFNTMMSYTAQFSGRFVGLRNFKILPSGTQLNFLKSEIPV